VNKYVETISNNDYGLRKTKSYNGSVNNKYNQQNTLEEINPLFRYQTSEFCLNDLKCFPEDINDMAKRIIKGIYIYFFLMKSSNA